MLKVWEALYRVILKTYTEENQKNDLLQEVSKFVSSSVESKKSPLELMEMVNGIATRELHNKVMLFIDQNIVKNHGNSGVTLSLKIAMPMWLFLYQSEAVIGTLESQVQSTCYLCLLRLTETTINESYLTIWLTCAEILSYLKSGGFTVHIGGDKWRAVALDEANEMCVDKDMKSAVTYLTEQYLQKTSLFFNNRIKLTKSFLHQLFPQPLTTPNSNTIQDVTKNCIRTKKTYSQ